MTKLSKYAVRFFCLIAVGLLYSPVSQAKRVLYQDQFGRWQVVMEQNKYSAELKEKFSEVTPESLGLTQRVYLRDGNFAYATEFVGHIECAGSNGMLRIKIQEGDYRHLVWKNKSEVLPEVAPATQGLPKNVYFSDGYPSNLLTQISTYGQAVPAAQNLFSYALRRSAPFEGFGEIDFLAPNGRLRIHYLNPQGQSQSIWKKVSEVSPEVTPHLKEKTAEFDQKSMRGNIQAEFGTVLKESKNGRILIRYHDEYQNLLSVWKDKSEVRYQEQLDDPIEELRIAKVAAESSSITFSPPHADKRFLEVETEVKESPSIQEQDAHQTPLAHQDTSTLSLPDSDSVNEPPLTMIAIPSLESGSSKAFKNPQTNGQFVHFKKPKMQRSRLERFLADPISILKFTQEAVLDYRYLQQENFVELLDFNLLNFLLNQLLDFAYGSPAFSELNEPSKRTPKQVAFSGKLLLGKLQEYQPSSQEEMTIKEKTLPLIERLLNLHQEKKVAFDAAAAGLPEEVD